MNKLWLIFGFCFVSSLYNMDLMLVSDIESNNFSTHLNMAVGFGEKVVQDGSLSATNSMHIILTQLKNDLSSNYNNDIRNMIKSNKKISDGLKQYDDIENHDVVKFGLAQVRKNKANVNEAKQFVTRYRSLSAGLQLAQKYSTYSNAWMGEVQKEERINYMLRNGCYPTDEKAVQDYWVMFIYQLLFAPKMS